jgi:hypothetical protein
LPSESERCGLAPLSAIKVVEGGELSADLERRRRFD